MPVTKCPRKSEPLWKGWDRKAQKNGLRHQVFAVNGDHYVGEWKGNLKHGKQEILRGLGASMGSEWVGNAKQNKKHCTESIDTISDLVPNPP